MVIRAAKGKVKGKIPVENVLISVFYKDGLEELVPSLLDMNPNVRFLSSTGTHTRIGEILGKEKAEKHLVEVGVYTGTPEMEGGLVKTLDPVIHGGILGERNNPDHVKYLKAMNADFIDMVIVNLYPFREILKKIEAEEINPKTEQPYNFEDARGNIDIGGPAMLRAAAKNFLGCASVCDPKDYEQIVREMREGDGCTNLELRLYLAKKAFELTAAYDKDIAPFMGQSYHYRKYALRVYDIEKEGGR